MLGYPVDENLFAVAPVVTLLERFVPGSVTDQVLTYYLRAKFDFAGDPFGATLYFTAVVDDGMVLYLNGVELQRVAMPVGPIDYSTLSARASEVSQHGVEHFVVIPTNLLAGQNTLAVELHQGNPTSTDAIFGLGLAYLPHTPPGIASPLTNNLTVEVNRAVALQTGISGNPISYQWQRDDGAGGFSNMPSATWPTLTNLFTTVTSVSYRVIGSNTLGRVTNGVSRLEWIPDQGVGPVILSAQVLEDSTRTNRIVAIMSETLNTTNVVPTQTDRSIFSNNFRVTLAGTPHNVTVSNVFYNPGTFPLPGTLPILAITMSTADNPPWSYRSNYYLVLNNVRDTRQNTMAPNSAIGIDWPYKTNVIPTNAVWEYHNQSSLDPTVYQTAWNSVGYDTATNGFWQSNSAVLWRDPLVGNPATNSLCMGEASPASEIAHSSKPILLRRQFDWPAGPNTNVSFTLRHVLDDGAIFYLNGVEIHRVNVPGVGKLNDTTRAYTNCLVPRCGTFTNSAGLRPGRNVLAAALCQTFTSGDADLYFGASLDISSFLNGSPPVDGAIPELTMGRIGSNGIRVSWPSNLYNYALMTATNIASVGSNTIVGPWRQAQPGMGNPYTNNPARGSLQLYRLEKVH